MLQISCGFYWQVSPLLNVRSSCVKSVTMSREAVELTVFFVCSSMTQGCYNICAVLQCLVLYCGLLHWPELNCIFKFELLTEKVWFGSEECGEKSVVINNLYPALLSSTLLTSSTLLNNTHVHSLTLPNTHKHSSLSPYSSSTSSLYIAECVGRMSGLNVSVFICIRILISLVL